MPGRRRAPRLGSGRPDAPARDRFSARVDPAIIAEIRAVAKRKKAQVCQVMELALLRYIQEDTAGKVDAHMAPLIDRVIETRMKTLEGGLRTMIARLAHENLAIMYVVCNFIVEANVPPGKVEKWRKDGYKFAVQEFRKRPNQYEVPPDEDH